MGKAVEHPQPWRLTAHQDERGSLVVAEANRDVPFPIRRVFWVYDVPEWETRGGHAHKACQQVLVCVAGACRVLANGHEYYLDDPGKALYVPPGVYLDLDNWRPDTVLLVLCSEHYESEDYVEAYQVQRPDLAGLVTV